MAVQEVAGGPERVHKGCWRRCERGMETHKDLLCCVVYIACRASMGEMASSRSFL